mmetsp:Transcript_124869/g.195658  ORF Transcript_124869/g.195658 Transcript_124869/m.195658 type:complete len:390 (-) Transcript_124869:1030-2199(-)
MAAAFSKETSVTVEQLMLCRISLAQKMEIQTIVARMKSATAHKACPPWTSRLSPADGTAKRHKQSCSTKRNIIKFSGLNTVSPKICCNARLCCNATASIMPLTKLSAGNDAAFTEKSNHIPQSPGAEYCEKCLTKIIVAKTAQQLAVTQTFPMSSDVRIFFTITSKGMTNTPHIKLELMASKTCGPEKRNSVAKMLAVVHSKAVVNTPRHKISIATSSQIFLRVAKIVALPSVWVVSPVVFSASLESPEAESFVSRGAISSGIVSTDKANRMAQGKHTKSKVCVKRNPSKLAQKRAPIPAPMHMEADLLNVNCIMRSGGVTFTAIANRMLARPRQMPNPSLEMTKAICRRLSPNFQGLEISLATVNRKAILSWPSMRFKTTVRFRVWHH